MRNLQTFWITLALKKSNTWQEKTSTGDFHLRYTILILEDTELWELLKQTLLSSTTIFVNLRVNNTKWKSSKNLWTTFSAALLTVFSEPSPGRSRYPKPPPPIFSFLPFPPLKRDFLNHGFCNRRTNVSQHKGIKSFINASNEAEKKRDTGHFKIQTKILFSIQL